MKKNKKIVIVLLLCVFLLFILYLFYVLNGHDSIIVEFLPRPAFLENTYKRSSYLKEVDAEFANVFLAYFYKNDVWVLDVKNMQEMQLTFDGEHKRDLSVSPDQKKLSYIRDHDLWVIDLEEHTPTRIDSDQSNFPIFNGWSPDSTSLIFGDQVVNILNGEKKKLDEQIPSKSKLISWAPDGKRISYVIDDILVVSDIDGSDRVELAHDVLGYEMYDRSIDYFKPIWSNDGRFLSYFSTLGLGIVNIATNETVHITGTQKDSESFVDPKKKDFLTEYGESMKINYLEGMITNYSNYLKKNRMPILSYHHSSKGLYDPFPLVSYFRVNEDQIVETNFSQNFSFLVDLNNQKSIKCENFSVYSNRGSISRLMKLDYNGMQWLIGHVPTSDKDVHWNYIYGTKQISMINPQTCEVVHLLDSSPPSTSGEFSSPVWINRN